MTTADMASWKVTATGMSSTEHALLSGAVGRTGVGIL